LLPDMLADLEVLGVASQDLEPLFNSAEGYVKMWEKALSRGGSVGSVPHATGSTMQPGEVLNPGQSIHSANGQYTLILQPDGNLVLYKAAGGPALWASNTNGKPVTAAIMQDDGNLVVYQNYTAVAWTSHTSGNPKSHLVVQDDGNVVIYRPDNSV